ncbi:MAG: formimidoylglutamate deiminase, partial [Proteobacteria bacterium]|nr:formimidoylglutamate deiminase [Pseudomonadota bacterium]
MTAVSQKIVLEHALLPDGWAKDICLRVVDGMIASLDKATEADTTAERISGIALPGLPNLHCHAFQRAMAGLAERRGPAADSFWTWRQVMYHFLGNLTPDDIEAITAFAYMEMLERGFTAVGEFHYLHHGIDGEPYANLAEMGERITAAAAETGIGLTLIPTFYAYSTFGGGAPLPGQRRFINDTARFLKLLDGARRAVATLPDAAIAISPHSLRAVTPETLREVVAAFPSGPIHMHAAEQVKEVEDCVAWSGARPIEWLLANTNIDKRWCLIHATHMTDEETSSLARSGAVAGLCPLTEASL